MKYPAWLVALLIVAAGGCRSGQSDIAPANQPTDMPPPPPAVHDPDTYLRERMGLQWSSPQRRTWRIEYRVVDGLEDLGLWHVQGTIWWVRIYPDVPAYLLDNLDKESVYEIDAVALNQNYGVIDFYIYNYPKKVAP